MEVLIGVVFAVAKAFVWGFFVGWLLMFMVWPVNDKQEQAPAWVVCRYIKALYVTIKIKINWW